MQKYIQQLIEDINQKAEKELEIPDYTLLFPDHPAIEAGLDYIVAWEMAPDIPMTEAFGISADSFPSMDKLTESQAKDVNEAILNLWSVNRIYANFPENFLSQLIIYRELRKKMQEDTIRLFPDGDTHIEFCSYEPESCPWGMDFCICKDSEWFNEEDNDATQETNMDGDDFPF